MHTPLTVREHLAHVEARLEVIEGMLGLSPAAAPVLRTGSRLRSNGAAPQMDTALEAPLQALAETASPSFAVPIAAPPTTPAIQPPEPPRPATRPTRPVPPPLPFATASPGESSPPAGAPAAPSLAPVNRPLSDISGRSLERLIGGRVFGAIGAIVVVVGIGLFLKYGVDQGWFAMGPRWKCLLGAAFGAGLLAAGETARRKVNALASAGLSAAGIGALYASAWAARARFGLVGDEAAFALLAGVTALGIAIALRARLLSVAVLSIVGAYLAPFVVQAETPSPLVLPVYSMALLTLGLVLSTWRAQPFRPLRSITWWGTVVVGTLWTLMNAREHPLIGGGFYLSVWAAVHAELFLSARRDEGRIFAPEDEDQPSRAARPAGPGYRAVVTSFATTVWSVGLGTIVMRAPLAPVSDWFVTAGAFVASICVGLVLAGNLRLIRDVPRTTAQRLGAGLLMQAGALLIATMALGLEGQTEVAAWLAMGVAAVVTGRWLRARALDSYGLLVLGIGSVRLAVFDSWAGAAAPAATSGGFVLSWWMLLMACAAAAWIGSAVLMLIGARDSWRRVSVAATAMGVAMLFASLLHEQADPMWLAWAWLVMSVGVGLASMAERRLQLEWLGAGGLVATAIAWLAAYPASPESIVGGFAMGMAMWAVAMAGVRWLKARSPMASRALAVYAFVVLSAACLRLIWIGPVGAPVQAAGLMLTVWTPLMVIGAAAWLVSSRVMLSYLDRDLDWLATGAAAVAVGLVFGSLTHQDASASSLAWTWLALAVATALAGALLPRLRLEWIGLAGLLPATTAWAVAYPLPAWADQTGLVHPGFVFGAALIGACVGLTRWAARRAGNDGVRRLAPAIGAGVGVALLLLITSMEVMRGAQLLTDDEMVRASALSIWWGLFGVAMIAAGFLRRVALCRHTGLVLILAATGKAVLVDFADVPDLWRIASFVGLGLLMLGVAVAYFRLAAAIGEGRRLEA